MSNTIPSPDIAFIKARWHADIVDRAHEGFIDTAARILPGATIDAFDVPGAFEMPLLAKKLALTGRYDAIVAAAFVVDGGIYRHDFVAGSVVNGLMTVQLETEVPVFSVSLTPHNYQPAEAMTEFFRAHFVKKGAEGRKPCIRCWRWTQGSPQRRCARAPDALRERCRDGRRSVKAPRMGKAVPGRYCKTLQKAPPSERRREVVPGLFFLMYPVSRRSRSRQACHPA